MKYSEVTYCKFILVHWVHVYLLIQKSFNIELRLGRTRSKVCLSSLYSTFAEDRLMMALSTLSLSLRYR